MAIAHAAVVRRHTINSNKNNNRKSTHRGMCEINRNSNRKLVYSFRILLVQQICDHSRSAALPKRNDGICSQLQRDARCEDLRNICAKKSHVARVCVYVMYLCQWSKNTLCYSFGHRFVLGNREIWTHPMSSAFRPQFGSEFQPGTSDLPID